MGIQDDLDRDYGQLCKDLTQRFGAQFDITSTGGGFYAITADLEGFTSVLVTNAGESIHDLDPFKDMEGFAVGVYNNSEQKLMLFSHEPRGLLMLADDDAIAQECGDLIERALRVAASGRYRAGDVIDVTPARIGNH